jgi:hypothetical protein
VFPDPNLPVTDMPQRSTFSLPRALVTLLLAAPALSFATGLATCESGPHSGWQPKAKLEEQLTSKGWKVRRIKEDGGCYEVYGIDDKGQKVEVYFHPVTLESVPLKGKH